MPENDPIPIRFGTDGWRAAIADDFTVANVKVCAQALIDHLKDTSEAANGLVVAWDTRFGSRMFANAVVDVAVGNGVPVSITAAPTPTPAASFAVTRANAGAGVVITASHNPGSDNGFKIKSSIGGSADPGMVDQIEKRLPAIFRDRSRITSARNGTAQANVIDVRADYLAAISGFVDIESLQSSGLSVVVDSMYGAGGGYLPEMLGGGATQIEELHGKPNPAFPGMSQPEPIEHNLGALMERVKSGDAAVGVATDGDADRVGIVDENGRYLTTLDVFAVIVHHLYERRGWTGPVVTTVTQSTMIERLCARYGAENPRTPVGFKYVGPLMLKEHAIAGGEESGGYAYRGHVPERDGILSGLLFLDAMVASGLAPSELLRAVHEITGPFAFGRLDLQFDPAMRDDIYQRVQSSEPAELAGLSTLEIDRRDGARLVLDDGAWALARFSGTEPLLRIYAEAPTAELRDALIAEVKKLAVE